MTKMTFPFGPPAYVQWLLLFFTECHLYTHIQHLYVMIIYTHAGVHHNFQHPLVQPHQKKTKKTPRQNSSEIHLQLKKIRWVETGEFEDRLGNASQAVPTDVEVRRPLAPTRKCLIVFFLHV